MAQYKKNRRPNKLPNEEVSEKSKRKKILYSTAGLMDSEKYIDVDENTFYKKLDDALSLTKEYFEHPYNNEFYHTRQEIERVKDAIFSYHNSLNDATISEKDKVHTQELVSTLKRELTKLSEKHTILQNKKETIDVILCGFVEEFKKTDWPIKYHQEELDKSWFGSRYHEEKLAEYKNMRSVLISDTREKIQSTVRDLEIEHIIEKPSNSNIVYTPETILIDGNNICYKNGSLKVGLAPLIALSDYLVKNTTAKVIVIFDPRIESVLKMQREEIETNFNTAVDVNLLQSGRKADEALLDFAEGDDTCYIISNDNYNDDNYADKDAVIHNRILKHEIIANRINIPALGIKNIKF